MRGALWMSPVSRIGSHCVPSTVLKVAALMPGSSAPGRDRGIQKTGRSATSGSGCGTGRLPFGFRNARAQSPCRTNEEREARRGAHDIRRTGMVSGGSGAQITLKRALT